MITFELNPPEKFIERSYNLAKKYKEQNIAYLSTEFEVNDFYKATGLKEEDLVFDYESEDEEGINSIRNLIYTKPNSLLFLDFKDKTIRRKNSNTLDIQDIRKMVVPMVYEYNVKIIFIDNFDKVTCQQNGRSLIWQEEKEEGTDFTKHKIHEYKMALLYFMSKRFNVRFILGKELNEKVSNPLKIRDIKYINAGESYTMVEEIGYVEKEEYKVLYKHDPNSVIKEINTKNITAIDSK